MSSSCLTGSVRIIAMGIAMTALIVFGLSRIEMTEGASQMAFGNSPITTAATKAPAVSTVAQSEEATQTSQLQTPADTHVRVILALK